MGKIDLAVELIMKWNLKRQSTKAKDLCIWFWSWGFGEISVQFWAEQQKSISKYHQSNDCKWIRKIFLSRQGLRLAIIWIIEAC